MELKEAEKAQTGRPKLGPLLSRKYNLRYSCTYESAD